MTDFVEGKNPCPKCRKNGGDNAGNNFHWYGEGKGGHCFACEFTIPSDEHKKEMGWEDEEEEEEVTTKEKITDEQNEQIKSYTSPRGQGYRGIRDEINAFFGVRYEYDEETGKPIKQFVPTTIGGDLVGYKTRVFPKDFTNPVGITGKDCDMIGQFRFKNHTRVCLLVGGEIKQMAAYQMLKDSQEAKGYDAPAVVAPTCGEGSAFKQIQKNYAFFDQFEKVIVCMDNDAKGQEANEKAAKVLPKGKVFIMKMRYKDPDEYIKKNDEKGFIQDYWAAKAWTPDGIVASTSLGDRVREAAAMKKIPLPPFMHKLQKMMAGGIPLKMIVNLASASGTGKSTIVDEMAYYWIFNSPYKPGIVTMESDSGQYGTKILSRHIGRKIDLIESDSEKLKFLDEPWVKEKEKELYFNEDGSPRFYLIEERDGGLESLKSKIEELIIACGCQLIVLDPLQDILDGLTNEEQAVFMRWLKGMVKSHDVTFILVNHTRKSTGGAKAGSTGGEMYEEDIQGSSSIYKSAGCNLLFTRDKEAEDLIERNTTNMKASKIRWTGKTGGAGQYYYDIETHTLYDKEDWLEKNPVDFETGEIRQKFTPAT